VTVEDVEPVVEHVRQVVVGEEHEAERVDGQASAGREGAAEAGDVTTPARGRHRRREREERPEERDAEGAFERAEAHLLGGGVELTNRSEHDGGDLVPMAE
jgi:hypothetical protein